MREIAREVAQRDLDKARSQFETAGQGSELDRAAQMVIQSMQVLRNRVDKPSVLKLLYFDKPGAGDLLPGVALEVVEGLRSGKITSDDAKEIIDEAIPAYIEAFGEMGLKPENISALYGKGVI